MSRVAFYTLGCKVNQYETDAMTELFKEAGYEIADFHEPADIYIINTCTVTNIADRKSRQMLHRAKKQNPDSLVVAVGCYAQEAGEALTKDAAVDLVVGNNRKKDIVQIVAEAAGHPGAPAADVIDMSRAQPYETLTIHEVSEHTRAYIKIQDGCNQFCSYCIIPYARGRGRSRQPEDILEEVRGLAKKGFKEIVLTGIHISSYGLDFEGVEYDKKHSNGGHLIRLIEQLDQVDGLERIRLSSLEPRLMTEEFVKRLAAVRRICPHFHLSLQSGCDTVLARMNRKYTTDEYLHVCGLLRTYFDRPALTTDVIVGFPQETEEEFAATVDFVQKVGFAQMHVFKYSRRQGTRAAAMEGQVDEQVKNERSAALLAVDERLREAYIKENSDKILEVLAEEIVEAGGQKYMVGHSKEYIKVGLEDCKIHENQVVSGKMTGDRRKDFVICERMD